jgi:hypothetical protein
LSQRGDDFRLKNLTGTTGPYYRSYVPNSLQEEHHAEKCTRFSAFNDAQAIVKASDSIRKKNPFFGPML